MRVVSYVSGKLQLLLCIVLASRMIYIQFQTYQENHDSSSVLYKQFSEEKDDVYPVWSFCFASDSGRIFKPSLANKQVASYRSMLMGNENLTKRPYEDAVHDYLGDGAILLIQIDGKQVWKHKNGKKQNVSAIPLAVTYQDFSRICFTKNDGGKRSDTKDADVISFNASYLEPKKVNLELYVHQMGQLMKNFYVRSFKVLHVPDWQYLKNEHSEGEGSQKIKYMVEQVEILMKRPNAQPPCNPALTDEDRTIKNEIIRSVGCVPAYWKNFAVLDPSMKNFPTCNTKEQLQNVSGFLPTSVLINHITKDTQHLYINPCRESKIFGKNVKGSVSSDNSAFVWNLELSYTTDVFRLITNEQAFTGYDLWSQIGGFVGIFLGYSLLQVSNFSVSWIYAQYQVCNMCICVPLANVKKI